jgi:MFS family permease
VLSFALAQGMAVPAVPHIAADLHISLSAATWVLSGNLAMTAVCLPLIGRLGDMYGRRPTLLVALALVVVGGVLAGLAHDFGYVIAGRVIQGAGGGVFSLCYGLAREVLPPNARTRSVGVLAACVGIGGVMGLPFGGALIDVSSYQWLLLTTAFMAVVAFGAVLLLVPKAGLRSPARLDIPGVVALTAAVTLPLFALGRVGDSGWSDPVTLVLAVSAVVALAILVGVERRVQPPLVDVRTAWHPQVALTNAVTLVMGGANFAVMVLVTEFAQAAGDGLGVSATRAGLLLLPGSVVMIGVGVVCGWITRRIGNRLLLVGGCIVATAGLAFLAVLHATQVAVALGVMVVFSGVAASFAAVSNLIIDVVPLRQTSEATGVNGLFRIVGAAAGAQIAVMALVGSGLSGVVDPSAVTRAFGLFAILSAASVALALCLPRPAPPHHG